MDNLDTCVDDASTPTGLPGNTVLPQRTKKVLITLDINDYQPAIKALTFPLMAAYAEKIGAEFLQITERKFPEWPIVMEKFQCARLAKEYDAEWSIFFDADALINPEMFDVTAMLQPGHVCFNGKDFSPIRFKPDEYFRRDGRYIGACDWFCCAHRDVIEDLYRTPERTPEEEFKNIFVTVQEHNGGQFNDNHLIDDYTLSRNISRYGLKHTTLLDICGQLGMRDQYGRPANQWLWHLYSMPEEEKLNRMLALLSTPQNQSVEVGMGRQAPGWQLMGAGDIVEFRKRLFKNERGQFDLRAE